MQVAILRSGPSLAAIAFAVGGYAAIAVMYATVKRVAPPLDPVMVLWVRFALGLVLAILIFRPWRAAVELRLRARISLQLLRSALIGGMLLFNFFGVQYLQLGQVIAITFAGPGLTAILARLILKEEIPRARWIALLVGFLGVLVITRPSAAFEPAMLLPLVAAVSLAGFNIVNRVLSVSRDAAGPESVANAVIAIALGGLILLTPVLPFVWGLPTDLGGVLALLIIGVGATVAQYCLAMAVRRASASALAPYQYSQIVSALALGLLLFGEEPDAVTLIGVAVVIGAGVWAGRTAPAPRPISRPRRRPLLALPGPTIMVRARPPLGLAVAVCLLVMLAPAPFRPAPPARIEAKTQIGAAGEQP